MQTEVAILIAEAMCVYFLVLGAHSLRHRFGLAPFYTLIGGLTAVMSWVTDAGVVVEFAGITFMVGSTVFYTSLLLGVFVVYVFDGPHATRIVISTVAGVSIMVPVIALVLHLQVQLAGGDFAINVPTPSLRINAASVTATVADLIFLAIAWELLGKSKAPIPLWLRSFLTLLGVMFLDVVLFATLAFAGDDAYLGIMMGTFTSRLIICVFAYPFLLCYLLWQKNRVGIEIHNRPVLAILREVAEVRAKLTTAQQEIEHRKRVEAEKEEIIEQLKKALVEVRTLRGILPTCAHCKNIRDEAGKWRSMEEYITRHSEAKFTHGICPDCIGKHYPDYSGQREPGSAI